MYNNDLLKSPQRSRWTSGPVIVLFWFLFWPLGIYLTYKRAKTDKKAAKVIGIITIIFGALFMLNSFNFIAEGDGGNIAACIVIGALIIFIGIHTIKGAKRDLKYLELVVYNGYTSIDSLATYMSSNYDAVKRDIQKLMEQGYLAGSYIDDSTREIVFPGNNSIQYVVKADDLQINNEPQAVICKGCGASSKVIPGTVGECEFCGSPISVNVT